MSDEPRASQRWYPQGRTAHLIYGGGLSLVGAYQTVSNVGETATWIILVQLSFVLAGIGVVVQARLSHVEASGRGLRIVRPPSSDRIIAWHDIAEVRRVPPDVWSSKFGVVLTGGEIVDLRLSVDDRPEFIERWWLETDR